MKKNPFYRPDSGIKPTPIPRQPSAPPIVDRPIPPPRPPRNPPVGRQPPRKPTLPAPGMPKKPKGPPRSYI